MKDKYKTMLARAISEGGIDEGMEQIIQLIISYDVNDDEWLWAAAAWLAFNSMHDAEEEE